jgi:hypothetical protein
LIDLKEIETRHASYRVSLTYPKADGPIYTDYCKACGLLWPCDAARLLTALADSAQDGSEATARLLDALQGLLTAAEGVIAPKSGQSVNENLGVLVSAIRAARAAPVRPTVRRMKARPEVASKADDAAD